MTYRHSLRDLPTVAEKSLGFYNVTYVFNNVIQGQETVKLVIYIFLRYLSHQVLEYMNMMLT